MVKKVFLLLFLSSLVTACGQNSSHAVAFSTPETYRLKPGELILAASEDDILPIMAEEDVFVPAEKADLDDLEIVIGLFIGGKTRAYPVRLLSLHEVINDRVGQAIAVTWCPLCYTAIVYNRVVDGNELTFGASGYLLHDNRVLIDHQTETLWSQLLGQGIKGAYSKERLENLPSTLTTWQIWKEAYPETRVLSPEALGHKDEIKDPYAGYYTSGISGLSGPANQDTRLAGKSLVPGVAMGGVSKAYPLEVIRDLGLIQDQLENLSLLILSVDNQQTIRVYQRFVQDRVLTFQPSADQGLIIDDQTGTLWDIQSGIALQGELKGRQLERLASPLVFWFAWSSFYPETVVFTAP